jgi:hypothetical protein
MRSSTDKGHAVEGDWVGREITAGVRTCDDSKYERKVLSYVLCTTSQQREFRFANAGVRFRQLPVMAGTRVTCMLRDW